MWVRIYDWVMATAGFLTTGIFFTQVEYLLLFGVYGDLWWRGFELLAPVLTMSFITLVCAWMVNRLVAPISIVKTVVWGTAAAAVMPWIFLALYLSRYNEPSLFFLVGVPFVYLALLCGRMVLPGRPPWGLATVKFCTAGLYAGFVAYSMLRT